MSPIFVCYSVSDHPGADCFPDGTLLKEIGKAISSHEQCIKLALQLKIGDDNLYKLHETTFTDNLAYEMLMKWIEEKDEKATGSVLHAALCDAERLDLANRFEDRLFGRGKTSANQSLLYLANLIWSSMIRLLVWVSSPFSCLPGCHLSLPHS